MALAEAMAFVSTPQTVDAMGNIIQAIYGTALLICEYDAMKKFKLIVWQKGWYTIMAGTAFIILFSAIKLFFVPDGTVWFKILETSMTYGLIAIGSLNLAANAEKMWGTKKD